MSAKGNGRKRRVCSQENLQAHPGNPKHPHAWGQRAEGGGVEGTGVAPEPSTANPKQLQQDIHF